MAGKRRKKSKTPKGVRLTPGKGYSIYATEGRKRVFKGTCRGTINIGSKRLAIFSVPKR